MPAAWLCFPFRSSISDSYQCYRGLCAQQHLGLASPIAKLFSVEAIPHTFTIDADGILQDERIGDASIEGKLKKLVARAREAQVVEKPAE